MDKIIENIADPSWWFTIITGIFIAWLIKQSPKWLKSWSRSSKARELKKIKKLRWNPWDVHYQIAIERSFFLVFSGVGLFYLGLLIASPLKDAFDKSITVGLILMSPAFILEIIWLKRNSFLKQLLYHARKIA
ncbi:hypothetical protein LP43_2080 [Methylophaga thiooxydans]|uniref:Uncharacterized protein n=1 Tax=Methylophaga thiooxydans TaxID=392484 RepID=A0A0A0BEX7_9GAMM|nr:hypothetical protein [Methylophaga thiooxydans]KGM06207.1 hypothetical protein LP43_2080 [Methylophaga thiooxydans]